MKASSCEHTLEIKAKLRCERAGAGAGDLRCPKARNGNAILRYASSVVEGANSERATPQISEQGLIHAKTFNKNETSNRTSSSAAIKWPSLLEHCEDSEKTKCAKPSISKDKFDLHLPHARRITSV